MCLGRGSLDGPHTCGLAEEVFAALPWPCVVWRQEGQRAVMVNAAFKREFGIACGRAGPAWLEEHFQPTAAADEFVFRDRHARTRRYHMTRQLIDVPPAAFHAVFLMALADDEQGIEEPATSHFTTLRPDVSLTPRESQVLDGIMCGKLNKVIAGELNISPKTVELHRANLMAKLRVNNVVELARVVLDMDLSPRQEAVSPL
ncbi:LuxR C-terminal-related transcriptional regulator [Luteibacter sp. UNCMF366Tsu5.1]|uniref:LuxR C-terminal-related transcriptional regulator n=1 Tax=Luteibacter sp. UNCMF366Tsu5.1 TaxID=1502758 RepID=UPI000908AFE5|nr:LuxR C-terminal-related transcriptional regulator [Luteibacter sp. UNCMF366Tsu5.1]SFW71397.1 regulatory protein, luxR family [Luteibacter sp. UNCMF366Tsu5.1]